MKIRSTENKKNRKNRSLTGNKKRTFGILAGLALVFISAILILSGCEAANDIVKDADMDDVKDAISKLEYTSISFTDTEDKDNVRSDFTLPLSGEHETTISWESSNADMVSINQDSTVVGSLKTGEASMEITLTATVSKGSAKQSKIFTITVRANENETPGMPSNLSIGTWTEESVYLEWAEALPGRVSGKTGTITGYTVYYSTSNDFFDLVELQSANQSIALGLSTTTQVTGLNPGTQYYFAVTANNAYGEGLVSPSLETHTDTPDDFVPNAPAITGRSAGNRQVELIWTAPAVTGWKDGQPIAISGYNIYKEFNPITDTTGLPAAIANINPEMRTQTVKELDNGTDYYFAVSALIGENKETLPGGGDISVTPDDNFSTIRDNLSLSVEDFTAVANESGQVIAVDITDTSENGVTYGTDYVISISKAGSSVETLVYNPNTQEIDVADTISLTDAGSYTIRANGMGLYNEAVTDDFELTVKLSDTSLLEQALKALSYTDIKFAADEDENSVYSDFTVPLTGLHGSSIDWESDNPVVAISGKAAAVNPPDENIVVVTLTAELYLNAENASKEFIIVLTHPDNTLPGAPEDLAFTSWDTEAIGLSWRAEDSGYVDGNKASISAYTVYYSETGDFSDLTALENAGQYVEVSAAADSETETAAIVSGLTSGVLYSFAVSASNSNGEGSLSSTVETHTNSNPDAPVIIGRSAADQQIILTWIAPTINGWTDGHEGIIIGYDIYQEESAISDLSGLTKIKTVSNVNLASFQAHTATGLDNGRDYYFAVAAVTASGQSLPGGGDVSARPGDAITDLNTAGFTLSVEDAEASTNTPDQSIAVSLNDGGLSYGQDYSIAIIKGGRATTALSWDAAGKTIKASSTLTESDGGDYSIIASGMDAYGGNVSDSFILTVNLSDTDAVAAAQAALDISAEVGGDLNAVTVSRIDLPIDGRYDTVISWESSDENVIRADDGTVTIPAVGSQDSEVTLTATISKNTVKVQKDFMLIVKAPVSLKNTLPGKPIDPVFSAWTDTSIELSWTAPEPGYVGGVPGNIRSYKVYYSEDDDFSNLIGLDSSTGAASTLTISNLSPGKLYYFAVSASNANGEGPVSPSVSTRTNSVPGTPGIAARIAGDGQVELNWLAPALSGWKDGQATVIERYEIHKSDMPISAISGMTIVYQTANAAVKSYTVMNLYNEQNYYFAVAAVTAGGKSAPGGGDVAVRPSKNIDSLDTTQFALSIDSASIYTNSPGQFISVTLNEDGLIYGQDYTISISKGGLSTTLLAWNAADGRIDVIETMTEVGAETWTVTASGIGTYSGIVEVDFELEVRLSDAETVAAAAAALDIGEAVGGDADAVRDGFTLPLKGIEGTDIAWQSTDANIAIAPDGTVTVSRPAAGNADASITLQATISKDSKQEEKNFMLTIKAYPDTGNAANTAPGEPFGLMFSDWTENSIELSWSAPDAGKVGGSPGTISSYTVYYNSNNDFADLAALKAAGQSIDSANTTATVDGLISGQQYYFAISAVNAYGESSVSQSKTTRTNAAPGAPLISARNAGDGQVEIAWTAAQSAGWINGTAAAIVNYEIYQSNSAIADLTGQTAIHSISALARAYTIDALSNGESYYFAVVTVSNINGINVRSAPGGGDISVTPNDNLIPLTSTQFSLSIDNAAALTNTLGQIIAVNLNEGNLVYGQDYSITVSKAGTATTEIAWNPAKRQLDIVDTPTAVGAERYTLTVSGTGAYSGIIERSFELQISLSPADAVAAAKAALDIREAAGGDLNAVIVPQIALPLSGINGTDIDWTSNNPNVISANGVVSRPAVGAFDAAVILKASIRKDGEEAEKSFTLIVKAQEPAGPSTVPDAVDRIVFSDWSESSVHLTWSEVYPGLINGVRASISAYRVYYNTSDDFTDLETLRHVNQTVDAGTDLYAEIDGLESGKLYYFAVTASNSIGEGPVAQSMSTRTNSLPDRPFITGRNPGNADVRLSWLAPASAGWKNGTQASIVEYRIYQNDQPIDDVDQLSSVGSVSDMHYTVRSLNNDLTYYFAVTTVNDRGEESLPAGGEVEVSPTTSAPVSIQSKDIKFSLSVDNALAWTNTAGQIISIDLTEGSLIYGRNYNIVISKAGNDAPELRYDSGIKRIRISDALPASFVGDTEYTVTTNGMGGYKDSLTTTFVLTVNLSDADVVTADKRTLDISQEAGGNLNAVVIEHISLPTNGPKGSTITWSSSKPAVIADDGTVARPSIGRADEIVELTARIRKNNASVTRKFTLKVLALTSIANTAPGAPEDLQATSGELKVTLTWIAPNDRGRVRGQSASSLTYSISGHETLDTAQSIPGMGSIRGTVVEVENLKANTEYTFYVRASNSGAQSAPATITATALELSKQIEITAISYTPSTLEPMAGQTIKAISPALTPDTVKPEDPRLSFAISPTDFETQTGLDFDENTGRISGTASLTVMTDAVSYTIGVVPDTEYYKGTPEAAMSIRVIPALTATWNPITATAFTPEAFEPPSLNAEWTGTFSAELLPDGLDINPITGEISGETDRIYDAADYTVELTGRDDYYGVDTSATVKIQVVQKELKDTGFFIRDLSHTVKALTDSSVQVTVNGGLTHTRDYTLSISPDANGNISIDNDGTISIGAGITVSDAGDYTITATGQGNYTDPVEAKFTLNVDVAPLTSISYGGQPLAAVYNTAITDLTATVEPAEAADKVDFSIDSSFSGDTGLSFDTNSGLISGTPNKLLNRKTYTVTITGKTGTIYEGETKEVSIQVSVAQKDIADTAFAMPFADKTDADEGVATSHSTAEFDTDGLSATGVSPDYELSITGPGGATVDAVTISNDGTISIGNDIKKSNTGEYTVTATGLNNYTGSKKVTFMLTVRREITGIRFTKSTLSLMVNQTIDTNLTPTLTTREGDRLDDDNIAYTISPNLNANTGLTFDTAAGTISGTATTKSADQTYTITVVPDEGHYTSTATATIDIEVTEALSASYSAIVGPVNTLITRSVPDVNNSDWTGTFSATLPDDLEINPGNGEITGTPTSIAAAAAEYTVNLTGTGLYLGVDTAATVSITVNPKSIASVTYAEVHAAVTVEIKPSAPTVLPDGANVEYALDPEGKALPGGLTVNPDSGAIEGTPEAGTNQDLKAYTIVVSGTGDWLGSNTQATVKIKINEAPEISASYNAIDITVQDTVDLTYDSMTDGEEATFALADGESLPAGLKLETDGRITGTATSITGIKTYNIVLTGTGSSNGRSGTASVTITVKAKDIAGTLSYDPIDTIYGVEQTVYPAWSEDTPVDQTVSYAITPLPAKDSGVSLVVLTGALSVSNLAAVSVSGTYTITATGTEDYKGTGTKTFDVGIAVKPKLLSAAGFSFADSDLSATVNALTDNQSHKVTVNGDLIHTSDYILSISPNANGNISIDNEGTITIGAGITVSDDGDYTITAAGQNNYTGTVEGSFDLTVNPITLPANDFSVQSVTVTALTAREFPGIVTNSSLKAGTDYTLAITARPGTANANAVSIDDDGKVSITNAIAWTDDGRYTVRATGKGNYSGEITKDFILTVNTIALTSTDFVFLDSEATALTAREIEDVVTSSLSAGTDYILNIIKRPDTAKADAVNIHNDGKITIADTIAWTDAGSYTVKAIGQNNYRGEITNTFELTVSPKTLPDGFSFQNSVPATALTASESSGIVTHSSLIAGTDYTLDITARPPTANANAVSIDNDGKVTITDTIAVTDAGRYTVMATGQNNYIGKITDTFTLTVTSQTLTSILLGSISNQSDDFTVSAGITSNHIRTLSFDGSLDIGTDFSLAITGRPQGATEEHVSLNSTTGVLIITTDVVPNDGGNYTVTARGQGNYTDPGTPLTAIFTLSISPIAITSITYDPVTADYDAAMAAAVAPTVAPSDAAATYSINPDLNADTGLDFNTDTGKISGTPTSFLNTKDYTVTIAGKDGTKYDGSSKTTTVSVTVNPKSLTDVSGFSVSVNDLTTKAKTVGSHYATVVNGGLTHTSDYTLSIDKAGNTATALSIDNDGTISIGAGIEVDNTGEYTVKASGNGNYTGEITDTFILTVNHKTLTSDDFGKLIVTNIDNNTLSTELSSSFTHNEQTVTIKAGEATTLKLRSELLAFKDDPGILRADYEWKLPTPTEFPGKTSILTIELEEGQISVKQGVSTSDTNNYTLTFTGDDYVNFFNNEGPLSNYTGDITFEFKLEVVP